MERSELTFFAQGRPRAKARPRVTRQGVYTAERTAEWEEAIGWAFKEVYPGHKPFPKDSPLKVTIVLRFHATSWDKITGDIDNYAKAVLDGLNTIAWTDDRQILDLRVQKGVVQTKEEEGAWVTIRPFIPS